MRALTICQPYPHLILIGEKAVENRTWATAYRGPLLLHAGKSRAWLNPLDEQDAEASGYPLVFGAIVGQCTLQDCVRVEDLGRKYHELVDHKHAFGPFCFVLRDAVRFAKPIHYRGALGFFDVPGNLLSEAA